MQLDIRGRHLWLTPALLEHVERRFRFAIGRFSPSIGRVAIRLSDVNGPRGGLDKRCRVTLHVPAAERVVTLTETDGDLYAAVARAADRTARAVERALARRRAA